MDNEFTNIGLIYLHLIACCIAVGLVVIADVAMVKQLLRGDPAAGLDSLHLADLHKIVSPALLVLWITGTALIAMEVSMKGWEYLANPKLQAKLVVVALLTLNGFVLHRQVLPRLLWAGSLLRLTFSQRSFAIFTGAVSGVSWLYAAMLGIARPLNFKYSLVEILGAYPVLIAAGFTAMMLLAAYAQGNATGTKTPRKSRAVARSVEAPAHA